MKVIFVIFSLLSICWCLEDFSEILESSENGIEAKPTPASLMLDSVSPIIVPTIAAPTGPIENHNPCYNYCNYYPSYYCSMNCYRPYETQTVAPPQTKVIQVPTTITKRIPQTTTKTVAKQAITQTVPMEITNQVVCPVNLQLIKDPDNGHRCISEVASISVHCVPPFKWTKDRCVATTTICPNEYITNESECVARIACPQNYILQGSECIAPKPSCPLGWQWNGHNCQVQAERATCPAGYTLRGNECIYETFRCPPNYKEFGNRCVKEDPVCPFGYSMNEADHTCVKQVSKCPSESYQQQSGQCVAITYACPAGAIDEGDFCKVEETTYKIVQEIKYVKKTITIPGVQQPNPNPCVTAATTGYNCANPCIMTNNCIDPCILSYNNCVDPCLPNNNCIPTSG